jgi:hypothetical protein
MAAKLGDSEKGESMSYLKSHGEVADFFVNQMLKGITGIYPKKYKGQISKNRADLCETLRPHISRLVPYTPSRFNSAVGAVICKCAIKYGLQKALQFAKCINDGIFLKGHSDPAYLLWLHLIRNKNSRSCALYANAVTAARAYCEGRELKHLRESVCEIMEWSDDLIPAIEAMGREIAEMEGKYE